jgi:hypothetical protein
MLVFMAQGDTRAFHMSRMTMHNNLAITKVWAKNFSSIASLISETIDGSENNQEYQDLDWFPLWHNLTRIFSISIDIVYRKINILILIMDWPG